MSPVRNPLRVLTLVLGAAVGLGAAVPPASEPESGLETGEAILAGESPELVQRLFEKKSIMLAEVSGSADDFFQAYVIFEQPHTRTMRLLTQTARQIEFRPDLEAIEGVRWDESGSLDEHRLKVLFVDIRFRLRYEMDWEKRHIRWRLDEEFDNGVKRIEGFWELYPLEGERTLARFGSVVDVGAALPGFVQGWITRKNLPRSIEHCRRWVDSDGTYRP